MRIIAISLAAAFTSATAQTNAPPDKPRMVRGHTYEAMEKAIAPYVAKARETYPAAKKRFLAGLPSNYLFTVWLPFDETDKKTDEYRREYVFVIVDKITSGKISGRINNRLLSLKTYRFGQAVQFSESRVLNWTIVRPDGSEQGNYVGNFLDYWKPPKG